MHNYQNTFIYESAYRCSYVNCMTDVREKRGSLPYNNCTNARMVRGISRGIILPQVHEVRSIGPGVNWSELGTMKPLTPQEVHTWLLSWPITRVHELPVPLTFWSHEGYSAVFTFLARYFCLLRSASNVNNSSVTAVKLILINWFRSIRAYRVNSDSFDWLQSTLHNKLINITETFQFSFHFWLSRGNLFITSILVRRNIKCIKYISSCRNTIYTQNILFLHH